MKRNAFKLKFSIISLMMLLAGCNGTPFSSSESPSQPTDNINEVKGPILIKRHYLYSVDTNTSWGDWGDQVLVYEDLVTGNIIYLKRGLKSDPIAVMSPTPAQIERLKKFGYREIPAVEENK
jgi:hypothetical protein